MAKKVAAWTSWAEYRADERAVAELPSGGDMRAAFLYPADYSVGMSNLGLHYICRALAESGVSTERFFLTPMPFRSVERDTMLERFQLILAAVSYEGDIAKLARWLSDSGIPPSREERGYAGGKLVGIGGAITYINPLMAAGIADFIVLGDALPLIPRIADALRSCADRAETLERLAADGSILVPAEHLRDNGGAAQLSVLKSPSLDAEYGGASWVTERSVFGSTYLVELQRGCVKGCRFCTLPSCFRPQRQRSVELIERDIERAAERASFDQVGLITPEAGDYKELERLLGFIGKMGKSVSFASLRADGLTETMLSSLAAGGRRTLTLAPEAGTDELRRLCGKHFTNDKLAESLALARKCGISSAKLYFMLGLPDETDDDIRAIASLCGRMRSETGVRISAAVSPFVPKPGTAWEDAPFAGEQELKRKARALVSAFSSAGGCALQCASVRDSVAEYAITWCSAKESNGAWGIKKRPSGAESRAETLKDLARLGLRASINRDKIRRDCS